MKKALITGISGMCASYMAELLLRQGYEVHGLARRTAAGAKGFWRLDKVLDNKNFKIIHGDITDPVTMEHVIKEGQYDEIYNYAAQSHVHVSFREPRVTFEADGIAVFNLLEAVRKHSPKSKFFQASTSELYGNSKATVCSDGVARYNEQSHFHPRSPYGCSKIFSYYLVSMYREAYGIFSVNSIGFNKESPRRTVDFFTRKVTNYVGELVNGKAKGRLKLGNIYFERDWVYAPDSIYCHYLMMQYEKPEDFVVATGESHSGEEFLQEAFGLVGLNWKDHVEFDKELFRPAEVDRLCGDASKAKKLLGWEPHISFKELVKIMVDSDVELHKTK